MKSTTAFCLLAALCALPEVKPDNENFNDGLDHYRKFIRETSEAVKTKKNQLFADNIEYFFTRQHIAMMVKIIANTTFEDKIATEFNKTKEAIDDGRAKGKDVVYCLKLNTEEVAQIKEHFHEEIDQCTTLGVKLSNPSIQYISKVIEEAQMIFGDLHRIFAICYMSFSPVGSCISYGITNIQPRVKTFNRNYELANEVRRIGTERYTNNYIECMQEKRPVFWQRIEAAMAALISCVKDT